MGEWSDYFEDFPEENPANFVDGKFNPQLAAARRAQAKKVAEDSSRVRAEINRIIQQHRPQKPK